MSSITASDISLDLGLNVSSRCRKRLSQTIVKVIRSFKVADGKRIVVSINATSEDSSVNEGENVSTLSALSDSIDTFLSRIALSELCKKEYFELFPEERLNLVREASSFYKSGDSYWVVINSKPRKLTVHECLCLGPDFLAKVPVQPDVTSACTCYLCGQSFADDLTLFEHIVHTCKSKPLRSDVVECDSAAETIVSPAVTASGVATTVCPTPPTSAPPAEPQPIDIATGPVALPAEPTRVDKEYICSCGQSFKSGQALGGHMSKCKMRKFKRLERTIPSTPNIYDVPVSSKTLNLVGTSTNAVPAPKEPEPMRWVESFTRDRHCIQRMVRSLGKRVIPDADFPTGRRLSDIAPARRLSFRECSRCERVYCPLYVHDCERLDATQPIPPPHLIIKGQCGVCGKYCVSLKTHLTSTHKIPSDISNEIVDQKRHAIDCFWKYVPSGGI